MTRAPTLLLLLALQGSAWAGPVPVAEADTAPTGATLHGLSGPGLGDGLAAQPAASAASGSELAAQMIKEAEAGAVAADTAHPARGDSTRAKAQAASASAPPGGAQARSPANQADGDPWGLRDLGKAAVHWVKNFVPWLADAESGHDASQQVPDAVEWSVSPLPGGGGEVRPGAGQLPHGAPAADPTISMGYGSVDKPRAMGTDQNLVRAVIDALREVLGHPMTWLVAALFVIGGIVVKKIDRRPK